MDVEKNELDHKKAEELCQSNWQLSSQTQDIIHKMHCAFTRFTFCFGMRLPGFCLRARIHERARVTVHV